MTAYRRIVLIDDNDDDNTFHSIMIRKAGFAGEIVVRENGEGGLEFLRGADLNIPTLVFLDINMPDMNGFAVAEASAPLLRDTRTVVIVMLTSSNSLYDRDRAGSLEVINGFLTKPLTVEMVLDLLRPDA
ncbi:MAG: response regulator [Burkholderiales bacterium]|nr:response regulator [Burkholderiales bacterium]